MEMTKATILDICKEHNLYRTPHINDKLYLNFKGFVRISNLEAYTGLKALFLEGNALESLAGLPELPLLKCLYVQQNRIKEISDVSHLKELNSLNISNNEIKSLEGLQGCVKLETLICTHNYLETMDAVLPLAQMHELQTVDLQNNKLEDPQVLEVFKQIPNIKCLYLKGNPAVSKIKNYRKSVIAALPTLTYLDDRPVFDNERRTVEAWAVGGLEGERAAREAIRAEERARNRRNFEYMQSIRAEGFRQKRERLGLPAGTTDPDLDGFSDEEWQFAVDPPELVEARQRLASYESGMPVDMSSARPGQMRDSAKGMESDAEELSGTGASDGEIYLQDVKANLEASGATAGVRGLTMRSDSARVTQPSAQLREKCLALAADIQAGGLDHSSLPPLERLPAQTAVASSLHDLD